MISKNELLETIDTMQEHFVNVLIGGNCKNCKYHAILVIHALSVSMFILSEIEGSEAQGVADSLEQSVEHATEVYTSGKKGSSCKHLLFFKKQLEEPAQHKDGASS